MFGLLFGIIPGLARSALEYFNKKADVELQGYTTGTQADTERLKHYLSAQVEINRLKLGQQSWWGARLIILIVGLPAAIHMGAIFIDSTFMLGCGKYGCMGIPKIPAPYDTYEYAIVQSFIIITPAQPLLNSAAAWLRRK